MRWILAASSLAAIVISAIAGRAQAIRAAMGARTMSTEHGA